MEHQQMRVSTEKETMWGEERVEKSEERSRWRGAKVEQGNSQIWEEKQRQRATSLAQNSRVCGELFHLSGNTVGVEEKSGKDGRMNERQVKGGGEQGKAGDAKQEERKEKRKWEESFQWS